MSDAKIVISAEDKTRAAFASLRGNVVAAETSLAGLNAAFGGIARVAGPAFAGISFTAFVRNTIDGIDALNDLKDATGASIENISALEDVALRTGTSFDTVSTALIKFNQALGATSPEQANIFKALGLDLQALRALDPAEAFRQTAVAINQFANDGDRARAIQQLLGKSVREVAPLLNDLATAGKLVATVTTQEAEAAEAFNKQLAALSKNSTDLARVLTSGLIATINELVDRWHAASQAFGGLSGALRAGIAGQLNFTSAAEGLAHYNAEIAKLDAGLQRIKDQPRATGFGPQLDAAKTAELKAQREELAKYANYYRTILNLGGAGAGRGNAPLPLPKLQLPPEPGKDKPGATPKPETIDQSTKALEAYTDALRERAALTAEATEYEKALYAVNKSGALATDQALAAEALSLASLLDQRAAITAEIREAARADEEQARQLRAVDAQLEDFAGRTADALRQVQLARLQARQAAGEVFSPEELRRIYAGIYGLREVTEETVQQADKILDKFAENVQDAFGETVLATLEGNYGNILKLWGNLVKRLVAEAIAADLTKALFGDLVKGSGNNTAQLAATLFKAVVGAFGGGGGSGYPDDLPTRGGRAGGGRVDAGYLYEVNEQGGPGELFRTGGRDYLLPANDGVIIPNGERGASGAGTAAGAVTVQIVNNGRPMEVQQTSQESTSLGTLIKVVTREVARDFATGGAVSKAAGATFGLQRVAGAPRRG